MDLDKKAKWIQRIRKESALWGRPLDDLTDEEVESGIKTFGEGMKSFGLNMREATDALNKSFSQLN